MMTLKDKISLINEIFDKREAEQIKFLKESREKEIAKTIVNDTIEKLPFMSIGNMVSIFESISPDIIKTKNGKKIINDFTAIVKEDVNIKNSYLLRENVFSGNFSGDPRELIEESVTIANETNKPSEIHESKHKLADFISGILKSFKPEDISNKITLDESIERINNNLDTIMWGKRKVGNAAERVKSMNETIDYMASRKNTETTNSRDDEVFEECKNECINALDEAWKHSEGNVRMKLTEIKDKVSKKMFSELTVKDDIKYMRELIETIK